MKYRLMICDDESVILSPAEVHALPQIQAWDAEVDARGIRPPSSSRTSAGTSRPGYATGRKAAVGRFRNFSVKSPTIVSSKGCT
jgi:hypothetical protein